MISEVRAGTECILLVHDEPCRAFLFTSRQPDTFFRVACLVKDHKADVRYLVFVRIVSSGHHPASLKTYFHIMYLLMNILSVLAAGHEHYDVYICQNPTMQFSFSSHIAVLNFISMSSASTGMSGSVEPFLVILMSYMYCLLRSMPVLPSSLFMLIGQ